MDAGRNMSILGNVLRVERGRAETFNRDKDKKDKLMETRRRKG